MDELTLMIKRWLAANDIPEDGFALVLNFRNAHGGMQCEEAVRREMMEAEPNQVARLTLYDEFEVNGITVRVQSPLQVF
ncbi:hypothetical protein [Bradyrhizobium cenepequi]|uniref:hypothetical protein n=1 Tax=Bradyrhizobium cenepequi TaxID=2821403 RepID=UPI001CE341D3|nr:hypothetical protein [Bradyrhizobium cenepequi]MCA6106946.1 hypothetical protein [Bradyrhizobium cenepequi]